MDFCVRGRPWATGSGKSFHSGDNSNGTVIDWREWDDEWFRELLPQNPRPILTDGFRGRIIAWLDETNRSAGFQSQGPRAIQQVGKPAPHK